MSFDLKPTRIGLPFHGLVDDKVLPVLNNDPITLPEQPKASGVLLNKARGAIPVATTEPDKGWDFKDRLLVPALTGLADDEIIFIDSSDTPYLIKFTFSKAGKVITVIATLIREYGVLSTLHVADFNTVIFNESLNLAVTEDTAFSTLNATPLGVEQDPSGKNVLINLTGTFVDSGRALIGVQNWSVNSILKATFSGYVDKTDGSGINGTVSVFKTAEECCPAFTTATISKAFNNQYRMGQTESLSSWTEGTGGGGWYNALINMSSSFFSQLYSSTELNSYDDNSANEGTAEVEDKQLIISYAYYDNSGNEALIELEIIKNKKKVYDGLVNDYTTSPTVAAWSYHSAHAFGNSPGTYTADIHSPAAGVPLTKTETFGTGFTETKTYSVDILINSQSQEIKSYEWKRVYSTSSATEYYYAEWPKGEVASTRRFSADADGVYNAPEAPWLYPDVWPGSLYSPTTKFPVSWSAGTGATTVTDLGGSTSDNYTVTDWGEELYSGATPPTDDAFANFNINNLISERFASIENTRTNSTTPAHSAYGASAADHKPFIAYDPYTDTITDSDTPIGYV